jgi:hypothetical protein
MKNFEEISQPNLKHPCLECGYFEALNHKIDGGM